MICDKCSESFYLQAFSTGYCKVCGENIISPHIPGYTVCQKCANLHNLCEQCGANLNEGEPSHLEET